MEEDLHGIVTAAKGKRPFSIEKIESSREIRKIGGSVHVLLVFYQSKFI